MSATDQVFHVLTEFRFDAAEAVADAKGLQGAVQQLSDTADSAFFSLKNLASGFTSTFGLGVGGIAGILYTAVTASDKFYQSQIKLSNIMQNAGFFKGPNAFRDAMLNSEAAMNRIHDTAQKFSLPAADMLATTQLIAPVLLSKGLDNSSLSKSTDISRMFLKTSGVLGVDSGLAMGELTGMLQGRAHMQGQFNTRLFNDTQTLRPYAGQGGTQRFNLLPDLKRLELVSKAMGEFANNLDAAGARAASFTGQLQFMKDQLFGAFSIFRSLGTVLMGPLVQIMTGVNNYLKTAAPIIIKNFADILKGFVQDPEKLLVNIMQARNLKTDVKSAGSALGFGGLVEMLVWGLGFFSTAAKAAVPWAGALAVGVDVLGQTLARAFPVIGPIVESLGKFALIGGVIVTVFGYFGKLPLMFSILGRIAMYFADLFLPLALLIGFFQAMSRAAAMAKIDDAKALAAALPSMSESLARLKRAFDILVYPITYAIDALARFAEPLFKISFWFDVLAGTMDAVTEGIALFVGGLQGVAFAVMQILDNISNFSVGNMDIFKGVTDAFTAGTDDIFEKIYGKSGGDDIAAAKTNVNIGKIEIRNDFKDQMEPDRVAFSIKEQILKSALNPTSANGRSLKGSLATS